jgi:hypothetical protein
VIPGALNRMNAVFGRYIPRAVFLRLARRFWPA